MKKLLFIFLLLTGLSTVRASSDTSYVDSLCYVQILVEPTATGAQLTAFAFDHSDPTSTINFAWSTGDTSQSIPLLASGTYCVTATSVNTGCVSTDCIVIDLTDCGVSTWYLPWTNELFANASGIPPFQYLWSNGDTTPSITAVVGDAYCVTVTDFLGCIADTCGVVEGHIDTFCFADIFIEVDSIGNIVLNAIGGGINVPPNPSNLGYEWSTGDTTASIIVTSLEEYCVTVTNGICSAESCIDLTALDCDVFIGCDPPGTFTAFAQGVHPFTYTWNTGESTQQIPVTAGETYCVTITDALGCTSDTCMVADSVVFPPDSFCFVLISHEANAAGIELTAIGFGIGDSIATYAWSTGENTMSIIGNSSETYCVTVTYVSGCVASTCITLNAFDCTDLYVLCDPDGTLGVISSGLPPFTYLWSTGDTTEFILGETDSTYCVTITDATNCVADTCVTVMAFPPDTFNFPASIFGNIYEADTTVMTDFSGWVYLYKKDTNGIYILVDSTPILADLFLSGYYFEDVEDGEYLTKAVAFAIGSGDSYIPTYHYSAMEWNNADVIVVDANNPNGGNPFVLADIALLGTTTLTGPGTINGTIIDINNIINEHTRNGSGFEGVTIILTDEQDQTLLYIMTESDGAFTFENLPYGTYHVHADYINLTGPYAIVTIGPNSEQVEISFKVDGETVFLSNNSVDLLSEISIYPNPATDRIFVKTSNDILVQSINVSNMQGNTVVQFNDIPTIGMEINTTTFNSGMHLIQLVTDKGILNQKIMVID